MDVWCTYNDWCKKASPFGEVGGVGFAVERDPCQRAKGGVGEWVAEVEV
jgi:hypothetical protein